MKNRANTAQYMTPTRRRTTVGRRKSVFAHAASVFGALLVLFAIVFSSFNGTLATAFAAEEENNLIKEAFDSFGIENTTEGFADGLEKARTENSPASFGYIIDRVFTVGYMNKIDKGVVAGGLAPALSGKSPDLSNPGGTKYACSTSATGAGTLVYSNCDVPNLFTEFLQDAVSIVDQSGPINAEKKNSITALGFGIPKNLPGDGKVPVNPASRFAKYTALELYGYNLGYTSYGGEWDHIKVMSSGRTLANFGFFDGIKMSAHSVVNGITSGLETQVNNVSSKLASGDVFGAISSGFTGFIEGAAAGGLETILDTSDLNVFATNSWYRVNFNGTTYGARELTDAELAAQARVSFLSMLNDSRPENASVDPELAAIAGGPPDPLDAISSCSFINSTGSSVAWGDTSSPPGPSQASCQAQSNSAYADRKAAYDAAVAINAAEDVKYNNSVAARNEYLAANPGDTSGAPGLYSMSKVVLPYADSQSAAINWNEEGTQELETIAEWKNNNSAMFSTAESYGMTCSFSTDEGSRDSTIASVKSCWPGAHSAAVEKNLIDNQTEENLSWIDGVLSGLNIAGWVNGNQDANNFSAPWNRYVCTNDDGSDVLSSTGQNVRVYDQNGNVNPSCGHGVRAPIQNGLFGTGYTAEQNVQNDTRHVSNYGGLIDNIILPGKSLANNVADSFLKISQFMTMISNEVMSWTFSPILQSLQIDKIVVNLIEGFRGSLFFPLMTLAISIAGLYVMWQTGVKRQYREQAFSILMIVLVFVSGIILMAKPAETVKMVDTIPAYVESAVIGAIYSIGMTESDELCTSSGAASVNSNGPFGALSGFTPDASTRTLMCENWRAFVFTPWVYGQFGTGLDNLYSNATSEPTKWQNTNGALVGDASVVMGNGKTMKNWGVYQLEVMGTGTSTTVDPKAFNGVVSKNFFKIVDAQAGPNNGAGTESRYLSSWSGINPMDRLVVSAASTITAGFGLVTITAYSFAKVIVSLVSIIMLIFIPFVFLLALFPSKRSTLKTYIYTIIGLMIQRVVLVVVLAVFFKILIGFANMSTGNYVLIAGTTIAACIFFLMNRKKIMDFALSTVGGETFGGNWVKNPEAALKERTPKSVQQFMANGRIAAVSLGAGALAGAASGNGVMKTARESYRANKQRLDLSFRRKGYGVLYGAQQTAKGVAREVRADLRKDANYAHVSETIREDSQEMKEYRLAEKAYNKLKNNSRYETTQDVLRDKNGRAVLDSEGKNVMQQYLTDKLNGGKKVMDRPRKPFVQTDDKSSTSRKIVQARDLKNKKIRLYEERDQLRAQNNAQMMKLAQSVQEKQARELASDGTIEHDKSTIDGLRWEVENNKNGEANDQAAERRLKEIDQELEATQKKLDSITDSINRQQNAKYQLSGSSDLKESVTNVQEHMKELDEQWMEDLKKARKAKDSKRGSRE